MRETPVKPGTKWGMLRVLRAVDKNESSQVRWETRCDCGAFFRVWGYNLVRGDTVSCGCMRRRAGTLASTRKLEQEKESRTEPDPEVRALGNRFVSMAEGDQDMLVRGILHALEVLGDGDLRLAIKRKWKQLLALKAPAAAE